MNPIKLARDNASIPLPTGIPCIDESDRAGLVSRGEYIGLMAPGGAGKSSFALQTAIYEPYIHMFRSNAKIKFIYFSFEMGIMSLIAKAVQYFLYRKFGVTHIEYNGKEYWITVPLLLGKIPDPKDPSRRRPIPLPQNLENMVEEVYHMYVKDLYGEVDKYGNITKEGLVKVYLEPDTPIGTYYNILNEMEKHGEIIRGKRITSGGKEQTYISGYKPYDKDALIIIIIDHTRNLKKPHGYSNKMTVDEISRNMAKVAQIFGACIVGIGHTNRNKTNPSLLARTRDTIVYDGDDQKDTGAFMEDCTTVMSLFNPRDTAFGLKTYFGHKLKDYPYIMGLNFPKGRFTGVGTNLINYYGPIGVFRDHNHKIQKRIV